MEEFFGGKGENSPLSRLFCIKNSGQDFALKISQKNIFLIKKFTAEAIKVAGTEGVQGEEAEGVDYNDALETKGERMVECQSVNQ